MALIWKKESYIFTYFHIFSRILLTYWFFPSQIFQKLRIYHVCFLFGAIPILIHSILEALEQSINNIVVSKI